MDWILILRSGQSARPSDDRYLASLDLATCRNVTDATVATLTDHYPSLAFLRLNGYGNVSKRQKDSMSRTSPPFSDDTYG